MKMKSHTLAVMGGIIIGSCVGSQPNVPPSMPDYIDKAPVIKTFPNYTDFDI